MSEGFVSKIPDKPIDQYTESEIKEMYVELFFWVVENRLDWLQECINRRKKKLWAERIGRQYEDRDSRIP